MPITPLHFGVLAPISHFAPNRVSNVSFVLVNLWMDAPAILAWFKGLPLPSHDADTHHLVIAMVMAALVAIPGMRSKSWGYGAFLGAISHILLDSLVHPEMVPFWPFVEGNPLFLGWMEPLSWALLPLTVWFTAQCVSGSLDWLKRRQQAA